MTHINLTRTAHRGALPKARVARRSRVLLRESTDISLVTIVRCARGRHRPICGAARRGCNGNRAQGVARGVRGNAAGQRQRPHAPQAMERFRWRFHLRIQFN
ncbi:hypothetical protein [Paraburkholderia silvatlantica]|uniref:hypothetical protein n=1 Tax=Paraburkholderia silvatlantica TaxID=321895 RepID=UPI0011B63D72|nr:hypothetical protein [Paraburkholderia silvatlantica]